MKHFLYIAQASKETTTCKIGITDDLARRLKTYNSTTDMDSPAKVLLQAAAKHRRQPAAVRL